MLYTQQGLTTLFSSSSVCPKKLDTEQQKRLNTLLQTKTVIQFLIPLEEQYQEHGKRLHKLPPTASQHLKHY